MSDTSVETAEALDRRHAQAMKDMLSNDRYRDAVDYWLTAAWEAACLANAVGIDGESQERTAGKAYGVGTMYALIARFSPVPLQYSKMTEGLTPL